MRELGRRLGELALLVLPPLLKREFGLEEVLLLDLFRFPFLLLLLLLLPSTDGSATTRSIVRNRALQQGHLFSVLAH